MRFLFVVLLLVFSLSFVLVFREPITSYILGLIGGLIISWVILD